MNDPVQRVHDLIAKELPRRQSNRVLHAHPSPTLWLERDMPVAEILRDRPRSESGPRRRLLVYVGTPYCLPTTPDRCGFCLFPSEVYRGPDQLTTYLRYLAREGQVYRAPLEDTEVVTVYFGGGTTNLYLPWQYGELMTLVRETLPRAASDLEVTVEGVAQLFTRPKLEAMREAGVNRVSMGVQQFDRELLKLSGRKQNLDHVLRMIELCPALGLACNVDLIFGWPGQSVEQMCRELDTAIRLEVPHITHYELNVAGRTDFARRRDQLPSATQNLEMYRISKGLLEANGYRQVTPYDWERIDAGPAGVLRYEAFARTPFERTANEDTSGYDVWGWGFAGLSRWFNDPRTDGWTVMNCPRVDQYYERLDHGQLPVERGFRYTEPDIRIYTLFQMLQGLSVDRSLYLRLFDVDPYDEHRPVWQALVERKWILPREERLEVVGDGGFHVPMIQGLLATARLEEMRRARREQGSQPRDLAQEVISGARS